MSKLSAIFVLSCLMAMAMAVPESRQQFRQQQQQLQQLQQQQLQHPYLFLSVPRGRANAGAVVQGFEIVEEPDNDMGEGVDDADDDDDDDDDATHDDDDDEMADDDDNLPHNPNLARNAQLVFLNADDLDMEQEDDSTGNGLPLAKSGMARRSNGQPTLRNAKPTQMMVARDQAGAIMVPDGIVEIEGQSVVDEKTGKAALLVPRAALDAIPDGAVVALMERAAVNVNADDDDDDAVEEERANRVIVRRRKNNGRRNVQRLRRGGRPAPQRRRRPNQRRRRVNPNRIRNVRVVRPTNNANRRRGNAQRRRGGQIMLQG